MSEETPVVNSNTQAAPLATPPSPTSTGPSLEDLQAKVADLEKAREGLIKDVQHERSKRQELESRIAPPVAQAPSPSTDANDELDTVLAPHLEKRLKPIASKLEALLAQSEKERALSYLSSKTKRSSEEILRDTQFQERLQATANKWGLGGSLSEVTARALELMEMEDMSKKAAVEAANAARNANIVSQQTLVGGTPAAASSAAREMSASEFAAMSPAEFDKLSQTGNFRKVGDKFILTPK